MIGRTLSHYRIVEKLGEGGMGVVYRAVDTRLERPVALKFLPPGAVREGERRWRFEREAKTASALNHPHIVTIYDIGEADGSDFIAMEYVKGQSLDRLIPPGGLPVATALDLALQAADALAAAHGAGIVHRDVKPSNLLVSDSGQIKVLDFGLAKLLEPPEAQASADSKLATETGLERTGVPDRSPETRRGAVMGTPAYMSPEQAQGKPVDARSDVFSFGTVLYEMLSGRRPFHGDSQLTTLAAILRDPAPPLRNLRRDVPKELDRVVLRCLEKDPASRYPSAAELAADLRALARPAERSLLARPRYLAAAAIAVALLLGGAGYLVWRNGRIRWARDVAVPQITSLTDKGRVLAAYLLAARAERWAPADVERLRREQWWTKTIVTDPPGAEVSFKGYLEPDAAWHPVGRTPLSVRLPWGDERLRIAREGYEPLEGVGARERSFFRLPAKGSAPPGMVLVTGSRQTFRSAPPTQLDDFWIDRYEVTNRRFQEFVDRGGYREKKYWKNRFLENGRELSFEEAMARFRDRTGRPGPATWQLGAFPEGRGNDPVGGVSWYEAAAYAEFAGGSLPTIYHWRRAADIGIYSSILAFSNFGGNGTRAVGAAPSLSTYGTYDMAGNVKEWCWNASGEKRYVLGGGFDDPEYMFSNPDAQSPFERRPSYGFRCVRYRSAVAASALAPIGRLQRDYSTEKPVGDEVFEVFRNLYVYDRRPLDARSAGVDESSPYWRKEKVSYDAGYGRERVTAYLFLPRRPPPWPTVVYFPAAYALHLRTSDQVPMRGIDFVVKSGRALVYPVYDGTYERRIEGERTPTARRDMMLHWRRDLGRTIDYIQTRRDLDSRRIALYGYSMGANAASVLLAMEDRIRVAILAAGGLDLDPELPEIDAINFVPRIRIPVLMINGRQDFENPVETSQAPLFRLLGTAHDRKKHVLLEGGHALPIDQVVREVLDWLDRWQGPVEPRAGS